MDRLERLRKNISLQHRVLEIVPYFNPIAPRAAGYRSATLDVFAKAELQKKATMDPNIPRERVAEIEDVDLLGSASDLADLTRSRYGADHRWDWIVSSHNFEHVPNPVRFLQQCAEVLRPEGVLRMAIPDKRYCFDHFRPLTEASELLQAFHEDRRKPTVYQIFRQESFCSEWQPGGTRWVPFHRNLSLYRAWFGPGGTAPGEYIDTHCWAFTPESFELAMLDLISFGLVALVVDSVTDTCGAEFFVDLRRPARPTAMGEGEYHAAREWLLCRCVDGASAIKPRPSHVRFVPSATWSSTLGRQAKPSVPQRMIREARRVIRQLQSLRRNAA